MTGKLKPENIFQVTSQLPYDRHDYRLVYRNGTKENFDNYMDVLETWYKTDKNLLSFIEVLDKKETKKKSKKGFN